MAWIRFCNAFVKITGLIPQFFCFRTKIWYEDKSVQGRSVKGPALIISNHTSVFDYAVYIFVFFSRTLRVVMAEVLFRKKLLAAFLRSLGGIKVDRDTHDFSFIDESLSILKKGGVVGIFPESRLPKKGEERPLPFKESAAYLALRSGVPVIPVVTDGSYFCKKRAHVLIGTPVDLNPAREMKTERESVEEANRILYERIKAMTERLDEMVL